jgi:GTP pyrophosphokinase
MKIYELFQDATAWRWTHRSKEEVQAEFEVGGIEYAYLAYQMRNDTWIIDFSVRSGEHWQQKPYGITGTGNAGEVFATVVDITRKLLAERPDIKVISFSADEPHRQSLYAKMAQRLLPTWKVARTQQGKSFYLTRPESVDEDVRQALDYATQAHAGQTRSGGAPYISHPVRVAQTIEKYKQSHNIDALIAAAYLHDTIEDTDTTHEALHDLFGGLVASLVLELTSDVDQIKKLGKKEYLAKKMAHDMSSYALVIKLADRLDNVQDIATAKDEKWRARYKAETEHIMDYIEQNRVLSGTHKKLIALIRDKINEIH